MITCRTWSWRQGMVQWYGVLRRIARPYWPWRQVKTPGEAGWFSSRVISGGPVQAVDETEAEVVIITTFPRLASTEVTMELAGDRLLIQGKTPGVVPGLRRNATHTEGSHDVLIRSAVLPCAVDLRRARVARTNDVVQITLPKKTLGNLHRVDGKKPG